MRKHRLPDVLIQKRFAAFLGDPSADVTSQPRFNGTHAMRFSLGERFLTIAVRDEDLSRSLQFFSRKYLGQVVDLFRNTAGTQPAAEAGPEQFLPVSSPGAVNGACYA